MQIMVARTRKKENVLPAHDLELYLKSICHAIWTVMSELDELESRRVSGGGEGRA